LFAGRYRVDGPIGSGGMGTVWNGYDERLDRRVAIKLMHLASTPAGLGAAEREEAAKAALLDRERFLREIRTTARLELPGIPAIYDFGIEEPTGRIYLVMQLLYGSTLADLIKDRDYDSDPMPISWAAATAAQVAATLAEVHRVDVVHRDIKPSNLMVGPSGHVKILDFGVAVLQGASALPKLTQIGQTVGSPPYMSREQVLGNPVGPATDIYALGCVLHEMVTGSVPFLQTASRSYQDHHVNSPAPSMRLLRPHVPVALDELVMAMLAKRPDDRPDAEAVYDALLPLIGSGSPVSAGERDPRRPFLRPLGPSPAPALSSGVRKATASAEPLTVDQALEIQERVARLVGDSQLLQAIDILEDAVDRVMHEPGVALEMKIELGMTLYTADKFSRAAAVLDEILPRMAGHELETMLHYYAGASHAETGAAEQAIAHLSTFVAEADHHDPLYRDAAYQLGMMLAATGRSDEALRRLEGLRPLVLSDYGPESAYVRALDRRIAQIRQAVD
jgi:serine/threonine protein kinase